MIYDTELLAFETLHDLLKEAIGHATTSIQLYLISANAYLEWNAWFTGTLHTSNVEVVNLITHLVQAKGFYVREVMEE